MKEDKPSVKSPAGKEDEPVLENGKKKSKEEKPLTKIVVRRLPPTMTEEQFKNQVSPLPEIDYFYFVQADMSLMPNAFCRAYINFVDQADLFVFTQKFDGYVFVDSKGGEYPAVVEFAPFQRIPKNRPNRKKDPKMGTIELTPAYIAFKERLEAESLENKTAVNSSKQHFFETSLVPEKKELVNTPLLDYVKQKRADRQKAREEKREEKRKRDLDRKKAKEEQRRIKKEEDSTVVKVLNSQSSTKERPKEKETRNYVKKKSEEERPPGKEKLTIDSRGKDGKVRTGKSYQEERQRQAERREEMRRRLSQSQSNSSISEVKSPTSIEDKAVGGEEKPQEERTETKTKDFKKPERVFKREEIRRNSYKYEKFDSKRDRDMDESRRTKRNTSDRNYQSNRRDEERSEDGGKKRYSELRRSHESSQRDRYKDKNKVYNQKKTYGTSTVLDKSKSSTDGTVKTSNSHDEVNETTEKSVLNVKVKGNELHLSENDLTKSMMHSSCENKEENNETGPGDLGAVQKTFEPQDSTKLTRRKSLDNENNRFHSTFSSNKDYCKEKYSERKRRNSVGSSKQITDSSVEYKLFLTNNTTPTEENSKEGSEHENKPLKSEENIKTENSKMEFEETDRNIPKRRNSTGARQGSDKQSPRRNSLGSGDKDLVHNLKDLKFECSLSSEDRKPKHEKGPECSSHDPRTERRIRNKDRPSIEIYRPGMGRFSKQRLEREKVLGSSTEVDSPSSSPSPTPVFKPKNAPH